MAYKLVAQTLLNKRTYSIVFQDRDKIGVIGFVAMQAIGLAVTIAGNIKVYPSDEDGEAHG